MIDLFEQIKEDKATCHVSRIFINGIESIALPAGYSPAAESKMIKALHMAEDQKKDLYIDEFKRTMELV